MTNLAPRITLISRVNCHLCADALAVISRVAADLGVGWVELDVDADPKLLDQYSEHVPVVLVDGVQHDFFRVDENRLRQALAKKPR